MEGRVGQHDDYGKHILRESVGGVFDAYGASVEVDYGAGMPLGLTGLLRARWPSKWNRVSPSRSEAPYWTSCAMTVLST